MGPLGRSSDWAGRPTACHPQLISALAKWLPRASSFLWHVALLLDMSVSISCGPFDPCDDMCRAPIHRTFVPWIMTCHLASILAQIHLHTISNQHLWNSLVLNPMLPFIPPLCMVFMPELTVKMGRIGPSTPLTTSPRL